MAAKENVLNLPLKLIEIENKYLSGEASSCLNELRDLKMDNPDNLLVLTSLAKLLKRENLIKEFSEISSSMISTFPDDETGYVYAAEAYIRLGDLEQAESKYLEALEINDRLIAARFGLADVYFKKKDYFKAKEYYLSTRNLSPRAINNVGVISLSYGDFYEAKICFLESDRMLDGGSLDIKANYASLCFETKCYDEALDAYNKIIEDKKDIPQKILTGYTNLLLEMNKLDVVKIILNDHRYKYENEFWFCHLQGLYFLKAERYHEALKKFNVCEEIAPWFHEGLLCKGLAYKYQGEGTKALEVFDEIVSLYKQGLVKKSNIVRRAIIEASEVLISQGYIKEGVETLKAKDLIN